MIHLRQDHERFGPAEGVLPSRQAHAYLAARFPRNHIFAATDLERYASCPFRFFLERVLEIEPVEDLALEFDVLQRGRVVHDVLAAFHRRVNAAAGPAGLSAGIGRRPSSKPFWTRPSPSRCRRSPKTPLQAALCEVDRRLVIEWLSQYRGQFEKYAALWQDFERPMAPELFEVSFGRGDELPPSTDRPLEFRLKARPCGFRAGSTASTRARWPAKPSATCWTTRPAGRSPSRPRPSSRHDPATAAVCYCRDGIAAGRSRHDSLAGRLLVRPRGRLPAQASPADVSQRRRPHRIGARRGRKSASGLAETVVGLVGGIRGGQFPVCSADDRCTGRCPYNTICRINQVRSLEKTCQPTATE